MANKQSVRPSLSTRIDFDMCKYTWFIITKHKKSYQYEKWIHLQLKRVNIAIFECLQSVGGQGWSPVNKQKLDTAMIENKLFV